MYTVILRLRLCLQRNKSGRGRVFLPGPVRGARGASGRGSRPWDGNENLDVP